jgi:hypothetical protein
VLPLRRQIGQLDQGQNHGRTVAQSVSRPSVAAEALFRFQAKVALMQFFPPNTYFPPIKHHAINALCSIRVLALAKDSAIK